MLLSLLKRVGARHDEAFPRLVLYREALLFCAFYPGIKQGWEAPH